MTKQKRGLAKVGQVQVATAHGYNTIELFNGEITLSALRDLTGGGTGSRPILVVSNLNGDYHPSGLMGRVIGDFGIDVENLDRVVTICHTKPSRSEVWVSSELPDGIPIHRIVVVFVEVDDLEERELVDTLTNAVKNVFAALAAVGARWPEDPADTVVSCPIGAGDAEVDPRIVSQAVLRATRDSMPSVPSLRRLVLVDRQLKKVRELERSIKSILGRRTLGVEGIADDIFRHQLTRLKQICKDKRRWVETHQLRPFELIDNTLLSLTARTELSADLVGDWMDLGRFVAEAYLQDAMSKKEWNKLCQDLSAAGLVDLPHGNKDTTYGKTDTLAALLVKTYTPSLAIHGDKLDGAKRPLWLIEALHMLRVYGNVNAHLRKEGTVPETLSEDDLQIIFSALHLVIGCADQPG